MSSPALCETTNEMIELENEYHRNVGIGWSYFDTLLDKLEGGRAGLEKKEKGLA